MSISMLFSILSQVFPPKPRWTANDIPDLSGKAGVADHLRALGGNNDAQVYFVTGGTSGIGKETVKQLLRHNATVYLGARHPGAGQETVKELQKSTGREAHIVALDLGSLKSVKAAAEEFKSKVRRISRDGRNSRCLQEHNLHVLINTA